MKYLVTTAYYNFDKKGNAKPIKAGTVISQKEYDNLKAPKKAKCEAIERVYGEAWLYEEDALAGHYYNDMIDPQTGSGEVDLANTLAGTLNRTKASIHMKIAQIKKVDSLYKAHRDGGSVEGLQGSNQMREVMNEIDPERYVA